VAHRVSIDGDGSFHPSEEQRRRWGLESGAEFLVQERPEGLLLRREDPVLARVIVEPTNCCNLACRTCVRNSWDEPEGFMGMGVYRRLVEGLRQAHSLRRMSFWGFGEPLLHPHILEMIALAKGLGVKVDLITNGMLLGPKMAEALVDLELDSLVVSADGATPESFSDVRQGGQLDLVRRNVEYLQALRLESPKGKPELGIEFVAMRRNLPELSRLRQLAVSMGASFVVVSNVLPYTEELSDEILYGWHAGTCYPVFHSRWSPDLQLPRLDRRREVLEAVSTLLEHTGENNFPVGRLEGAAGYCRFVGEGTAAITWEGKVSPCVYLMHSFSCYIMRRQKRIRAYHLGSIDGEDILTIWRKADFAHFRKRVQRFDFSPCTDCGGCEFAESNEEDCFGNSFPTCGDCLWAKGVLQCP